MALTLRHFNTIWPKIGGIVALVIVIILVGYVYNEPEYNIFVLLFWLNLALLMFHEFEEYVYPGGFKEFFNTKTVFALNPPQENAPVNESIILVINLGAWVVFFLGALLATSAPWLGIMMVIFNIANIFGHLILFQIKQKGYNPGFITALVLLLPFVVFALVQAWEANLLSFEEGIIAIIGGLLSAASLPILGIIQKRKYRSSA